MNLGWPELLILLVIVVLLFGMGRISKIASEMGKGIHDFREGLNGGKEEAEDLSSKDKSR